MAKNMTEDKQLEMWMALESVQKTFPNTYNGFILFVQTCLTELIPGSPSLNRVQADICSWLFYGPKFKGIYAQRGQAKTTLMAIFAVFKLIHNPKLIILIVSAGGKMSKDIASFVIQTIEGLDFLWMLVADKNNGDRASIEGYDIHWVLKGVNKSPSIKCLGIDSNLQGSRADFLIADDIESTKNSNTVVTRERLEDLTREFESICSTGDITYLGTPQSTESIYNNLPGRGYAIRIWTGRYPTYEQEESYGGLLSPMIIKDMEENPKLRSGYGLDGLQGKCTCPEQFNEETLMGKELSMGAAKFKLQFMLCTKLTDEERYPLKLKNLIVADFNMYQGPTLPVWSNHISNSYQSPSINGKYKLYRALNHEYEMRPFDETVMYIDPSGGGSNGDEMGYAVIKLIGAFVYICKVGGVPGGYDEENLIKLVMVAKETGAKRVLIEKNFGFGAHMSMLKPLFEKLGWPVELVEVYESGQKECRIIDCIEPLLSSHRLIIAPDAIEFDISSLQRYPTEQRCTYSLLHQMSFITKERGCLKHDDRLDALGGAIRDVVERIDYDTKIVIEAKRREEARKLISEWADPLMRRDSMDYISVGSVCQSGRNIFVPSRRSRKNSRNRFS
jgi:hypothetical protein